MKLTSPSLNPPRRCEKIEFTPSPRWKPGSQEIGKSLKTLDSGFRRNDEKQTQIDFFTPSPLRGRRRVGVKSLHSLVLEGKARRIRNRSFTLTTKDEPPAAIRGEGRPRAYFGPSPAPERRKPRCVTYQVAILWNWESTPRAILLAPFTNKAAREMLDRVRPSRSCRRRSFTAESGAGPFAASGTRFAPPCAPRRISAQFYDFWTQDDAKIVMEACIEKTSRSDPKGSRFPKGTSWKTSCGFFPSIPSGPPPEVRFFDRYPFGDFIAMIFQQSWKEIPPHRKQQAQCDGLRRSSLLLGASAPRAPGGAEPVW